MEFDHDIFVSYAHIDNQVLAEGQKGWVTNLHRALEVRLGQLLGKQARIWRDPKLQGNDFFADELVETLPRVALLISILSPRYVRSEWCSRELDTFCKASAQTGGLRIDNKARVFKVVKTPIPLEDHPEPVRELLGYEFFNVEPETGRARELSQMSGPDEQRLYWAKIDDLAYDISQLLTALEASAGPSDADGTAASSAAGDDAECLYLADTTFDLKRQRDAVLREVQSQGFTVLPDRQLPLVGPECEALVAEQLARCQRSIHLVGQNYGIVPEGTTESIVELQDSLARQQSADGNLSRMVWMPPDLAPEDERQQRLLDRLRTDAGVQGGMDLLEVPFEDFETELGTWLEPPEEEEAEEPAAEASFDDELVRIYLMCDQRDVDDTFALEDHLFDAGFEVIPSLFEGDESQVRQNHEENLVECDAVLLYYGHGNELWLRRKLREIQRSAGLGRTKPLLAKAIIVAPPEDPRKKRLRTREAIIIRPDGELGPEALSSFIRQIQTVRAKSA